MSSRLPNLWGFEHALPTNMGTPYRSQFEGITLHCDWDWPFYGFEQSFWQRGLNN